VRTPAIAIAWDIYRRNRWGLWAVAAYVIALLIFGTTTEPVTGSGRVAATLSVPLGSAYFFLLAVFSLGLAGDVAARGSMYPARMFTLPVTNAALAGWPMLYGTVTVAALWLATAYLAPWPASLYIPKLWPAFFLAAFLAWMQVLLWLPYPLQGMRMAVLIVWLTILDTIGMLAIHFQPPESLMVALFVPQLPLAFLVGRFAVGRARCGEIPDWRGVFTRLGWIADLARPRRQQFTSAFRAQVSYEWGQHGWSLPLWVAILLPFALALLFLVGRPDFVFFIVLFTLLVPPVMAGFVAASVYRATPRGRDGQGMATLLATRPMTSAAMVGAKLVATAASMLAAWLLVLIAVPVALVVSDTWPFVADNAARLVGFIGADRGVVLLYLVLAGLMATTWTLLVQSLYIGLSGRAWLIRLYVALSLAVLIAVVPLFFWVREHGEMGMVLHDSTPWRWALGALVALKLSAATWIMIRLQRGHLLDDRTLLRSAAYWVLAVFALYGVLVWVLDTPQMPKDLLMCIAILAIPLARISAAPLALDWNRHRW
jgi:hypothetical protein